MKSSAFDIYCALDGALDGAITCDEKMSRHVTLQAGGPADLFIECATVSDLALTLQTLDDAEMPWTVLGKGSNVLVSDAGYRGAIIVLGREFKEVSINPGESISAGAAAPLSSIVHSAFKQGLADFEFAVGIPGSLGGALRMNAGTREDWIGSRVITVTLYNREKGLIRKHGVEIPWEYRRSNIPHDDVILEAELRATPGNPDLIRAKMEASLGRRKRTQPISQPSAGSTFKNPEGDSAGRMIEDCGLKGYRVGGAQISELHANFVINTGGATAQDIVDLMVIAQRRVKARFGVDLEPEVRFIGFEQG